MLEMAPEGFTGVVVVREAADAGVAGVGVDVRVDCPVMDSAWTRLG